MKVCEDCGKEYEEYLNECPSCLSTYYKIVRERTIDYYKKCLNCSTIFESDIKECPKCNHINYKILSFSNIKNKTAPLNSYPSSNNNYEEQYKKDFHDGCYYGRHPDRWLWERKGTHKDRLKNNKYYREGFMEGLYYRIAISVIVVLMIIFIIILFLIKKYA